MIVSVIPKSPRRVIRSLIQNRRFHSGSNDDTTKKSPLGIGKGSSRRTPWTDTSSNTTFYADKIKRLKQPFLLPRASQKERVQPGSDFYKLKYGSFNQGRFYKETGLGNFNSMIMVGSSAAFIARWSNTHVLGLGATQIFLTQKGLAPKIAIDYMQKTDPLWWGCTSPKSMGKDINAKKVVRSYTARRIRLTVVEALKRHGYDRNGRRLKDSPGVDLVGSLHLMVNPPGLTMKIKVLQKFADRMVERIIAYKRKDPALKDKEETRDCKQVASQSKGPWENRKAPPLNNPRFPRNVFRGGEEKKRIAGSG